MTHRGCPASVGRQPAALRRAPQGRAGRPGPAPPSRERTMKRVTVDGRPIESDGTTILDAVRAAGADVPTICQHDRLSNCGACRMCLVHVEGRGTPVAACVTALADGMSIVTADAKLEEARKFVLEMHAHRYPGVAVEADPSASFHALLSKYGVSTNGHVPDPTLVDDSHPYLHVDMNQ